MDEVTQKLVERTRARQEAMQQMRQMSKVDPSPHPRKRRPLESNFDEGNVDNDDAEHGKLVVAAAESPSKRTKSDVRENSENVPSTHKALDADTPSSDVKMKPCNRVNLRMQKLLNQRKIWEAEEKGEDVSFDEKNLPTPTRHETPTPPDDPTPVTKKTNSLEHEGRKRRLAALAARVKGWEDDITHHDPPRILGHELPVHGKPPSGKIHLVSSTPVEKAVAEQATSPQTKIARQDEGDLSLSSLEKFAFAGKDSERPGHSKKVDTEKNITVLGNGTKTVVQTENQTITVNSIHGPPKDKDLPHAAKTLQQRMLDLQNNGITEADLHAMNTSSANLIMERARAEREKELEELRNRKVHGIKIHASGIANEKKVDDKVESDSKVVLKEKMDVDDDMEESVDKDIEDENESPIDEEVFTSACDKSVTEMDGDEEEEDGQELSYGDSMIDEGSIDHGKEKDGISKDISIEGVTVLNEKEEHETSDIKMIDEMFDGVLSEDEDAILSPPTCSDSPIHLPSLTRQKSKLEIKSELDVRKQTCNEAEDTHTLSQPSKFQKTCLSKSNSTESIVSLCQESDFPVYTISAYRTEKRRQSQRFDKRVVRNEAEAAKASMLRRKPEEKTSTQDIIADMMEQVSRQQCVIQQASAALNCCYDAQHGKGTVTEVEAEKLLLISSEKRLALLSEIQLLKHKKPAKEEVQYKACSGAIIINSIRLPLRTEYIFSLANKRETGDLRNHYYFVLVRHRHQMYATQLVSTLDDLSGDSLVFKDQFKLDDLKSDFKVILEVYSLNQRTRADGIPGQDKSKGKLSGILHKSLTPKKLRTSKRSHMPSMMSPGGPNAIRISNFTLIGSTTITLQDIGMKKYNLQKVPFLSPISGQILCKLNANFHSVVEQKGFLTMFDDVGGLGAWHRRWCVLRQGRLYSWTYPDDENHKKPLMTTSMSECISRQITTVERILCARPNTFELRTMRPRRHGDKQNLISEDTGSVITTKHWLSADTKEERIAWIECLNQALADIRAWDMQALKPFK